MTTQRFNGEAGEKALEDHCRGREEQDDRNHSQFASAVERGKIGGRIITDSPTAEGDDAGGMEL